METVETSVSVRGQSSSRVELLVRIVYAVIIYVVLYILLFFYGLAFLVNVGSVLARGRRSVRASGFMALVLDYQYKAGAYLSCLTDERPPIVPGSG